MRLFFGVVTVEVTAETPLIVKHENEFQVGLFRSQDEAVGAFVRFAMEKHRGGILRNVAAYQVQDSLVNLAARHLAAPN